MALRRLGPGPALLVVAALVLAGGCSKKEPTSANPSPGSSATSAAPSAAPSAVTSVAPSASTGIAGAWLGTYNSTSTPGSGGTFKMAFVTSGSTLSGTIHINNSPCVQDGTVTGSVSGGRINFGAVHAAQQISFTGVLSGDTMAGTYAAPACGNGRGTWTANRSK